MYVRMYVCSTKEGRTALHYACRYAKAKTVKTILTFLLEQFATFRLDPARHEQSVEFDTTRWTKYIAILRDFMQVSYIQICTWYQ